MARATNHRDLHLLAGDGSVTVNCLHCDWKATITTAPAGVDLVRQARLEAMEHAWSTHHIHAWDVAFGYLG